VKCLLHPPFITSQDVISRLDIYVYLLHVYVNFKTIEIYLEGFILLFNKINLLISCVGVGEIFQLGQTTLFINS